ncbi:26S proteasome regulatory complex, subunit PSMD10 [Handroanthus impetiginosus]|uniref:26S proteasome regulatory complex, subunit PSMD10 n=1 Tax=Handroanthus impetiginosus TaxID=429701 RepID=A0A2G9HAP7_9LAMI|nr:26S proteasome regulatory complex, subunit PSMD10 [Handroanthus impetiginosus]
MEKLVELSDHEIRIDFALDCKCRTTIRLKSLTSAAPVAFKVQTSSPHKFLVNPPSGLVPPLSSTAFQIVLKPQSHLPATFPRSPSDRFLVKTAAAPDLSTDSSESIQSELVNRWFNSAPHPTTYDVKLKVCFVGPFLLKHAVGAGDFEAVRSIIKRQRSVVSELPALEAETLCGVAAQFPEVMGLLLEAGLKADVRLELYDDVRGASRGWSELHVAAALDRTDEVEKLVEERGGLECKDKEGRTPLHLAASKGHLGCAKVLVSAGANVDARSKDGRTALYRAAANGDRGMVEMLLGAGADPTIGDVDHCRSAIDVARDKDHGDIVKILERGEAVLHAARRGELDILESLLEKGATANFYDQYGLTALHVAAIKGNKDVVMMLVEFGADVECRDAEGHTPLHLAVEGGNIETVEILINRGANLDAKTKKGATPLYISKLMEYEDITQLLLDKGAAILVPSTTTSSP